MRQGITLVATVVAIQLVGLKSSHLPTRTTGRSRAPTTARTGARWTRATARRVRWRPQTRPFEIAHPGAYEHYRLSATGKLAEVELLNREPADSSTLLLDIDSATAVSGGTTDVHVTLSNYGDASASGQAVVSAPAGWTVDPQSAAYGPIAPGESASLTFHVSVPTDAQAGSYPLKLTAGDAHAGGSVTVIGNTIEFTPDTPAEAPWLFEPDGSQLDGAVNDGHGRFADGGNHYTYRFELPADVTGGSLTIDIGAEYLVRVSSDNQTWREIARDTERITDRSNQGELPPFDLAELLQGAHTLYLRFDDSFPDDGWGAWLAHVKLELQRSG
jgi:hypothetical protein